MIYVVTALYCEAKPWIHTFSLKKNIASSRFQIFQNDNICLVITQQGKLNAAIAVTDMFHLNPPKNTDLLLNVGWLQIKNMFECESSRNTKIQ